ncbi:MAG TPA: PadR family transcriptional regulator [Acidimicrobiales bacterium]|nr:PadR family transcriptional regulator [Acidimicrobiales bacterium]
MPIFGYGDMKLYLLKLLAENPRYGYELIRLLEERFLGAYVPSAGAIYPRLSALEEEGLIAHDSEDGRKVYRITEKGERELEDRKEEIDDLEERVGDWAAGLADTVIAGVKPLIEGIGVTFGSNADRDELFRRVIGGRDDAIRKIRVNRAGMRDAARKFHEEDREAIRVLRREARGRGPGRGRDDSPSSLRGDLRAFIDEVGTAAREFPPDKDTRREIQQLLLDTRHRIVDLLEAAAPRAEERTTETVETTIRVESFEDEDQD